jgi:micrococcal nuclease
MPRPYHLLLPLLSLFLVRVDLTDLWPLYFEVKVLRVLDADTVEVGRGRQRFNIRLAAIDAPELGQPFWHGRGDAGARSTECALRWVRPGELRQLSIYKWDMYRRILGDLDGLSFQLVRHGCVSLYPYAEFRSRSERTRFLVAQKKAQHEKLGLWKFGGYLRPELWRRKQKISKRSAGRRSHR